MPIREKETDVAAGDFVCHFRIPSRLSVRLLKEATRGLERSKRDIVQPKKAARKRQHVKRQIPGGKPRDAPICPASKSGVKSNEARYLGKVTMTPGCLIQWIEIERVSFSGSLHG